MNVRHCLLIASASSCCLLGAGCRSPGEGEGLLTARGNRPSEIGYVVGVYNKNPWLNADRAGDPDPEAVKFRVFLYRSKNDKRAVLKEGTFHIEMYRVDVKGGREVGRELVADYHYSTDRIPRIPDPGDVLMGPGYFIGLLFPDKSIAGEQITIVVTFEDEYGNKIRAEPKPLQVPKRT